MKFAPIVIAASLAIAGSAFAQNESANQPAPSNGQPSQSASELGNKAKNGLHKLGDATKNAFNKLRGKGHEEQAKARDKDHDTRAMGAGKASRDTSTGSEMSGSRQQRMDDAYADYKSKQGKK